MPALLLAVTSMAWAHQRPADHPATPFSCAARALRLWNSPG